MPAIIGIYPSPTSDSVLWLSMHALDLNWVQCDLFQRLTAFHIGKGESRKVTLLVEPGQLQYWSTKESKWVTASGKRTVSVGASPRDLRLN